MKFENYTEKELYELAEQICRKQLEECGDCEDPMDVFERLIKEYE